VIGRSNYQHSRGWKTAGVAEACSRLRVVMLRESAFLPYFGHISSRLCEDLDRGREVSQDLCVPHKELSHSSH